MKYEKLKLALVLDRVTGQPECFTHNGDAIGDINEAIAYIERKEGWESRLIIVEFDCLKKSMTLIDEILQLRTEIEELKNK